MFPAAEVDRQVAASRREAAAQTVAEVCIRLVRFPADLAIARAGGTRERARRLDHAHAVRAIGQFDARERGEGRGREACESKES